MDDLNKKSVLIIDSDDNVLSALSTGLKSRSMLPITAKDGYDGYNRALKEKPDIILSEIILPTLDGFRLTKLLKFDERYMEILMILMSSNIDTVDKDLIVQYEVTLQDGLECGGAYLKFLSAEEVQKKDPKKIIEKAVKGMLPKNKLGSAIYKNLKVFIGENHDHEAQKPKKIDLKELI